MISLGIMALSFGAGASRAAVGFALATGVSVATYSFFAGLGVRTAGTVLGFQACLEIVTGFGMLCYGARRAARRPRELTRAATARSGCWPARCRWWASSPISWRPEACRSGPVTALRETSVIFGAVLGTLVLKEGFGPRRIAAALLVTVGIVLLAVLR